MQKEGRVVGHRYCSDETIVCFAVETFPERRVLWNVE